ncbi:MAG: cytidine deaminase [Verrucomicrobia bacterium]|nr:cytidine deaminase [Verrucomicrobiota bacterium]MBU4246939.1 cytidine deaminase [Verrucomicrobiota bacterium]MBU4291353.1 cytidine deaminase [Verrucomicrobiota bacterium]MBU4498070.1 cytidine deaminase [Verrucomicrobiota bacterium]MCG2680055.1 cytidine deaminase [Kiritimatiellia bacterium]
MKANQVKMLILKAADARRRAYAPYSKFRVGAALLTKDGRIFQGCNVENASYGLTLCAERAAVATAVAAGYRQFKAIAIAGGRPKAPPTPCGACLQVLAEFCRPDCLIILAAGVPATTWKTYRLKDLLPRAFRTSAPPVALRAP